MARMIPEKLSNEILSDPRKQGEIKVYKNFQRRLGNDWTVFYSVSWIGKVFDSSDKRDGETDFILANPKYGVIIAEVKGGIKIEYDGANSQWYSINKGGKRHNIKDPYFQARDNKYSFINSVKSWRSWDRGISGINICHAVIFPDISYTSGTMPLHAKKEITIYEEDLLNISNVLISIIQFACNNYKTDESTTRRLVTDIIKNMASSFVLKRKLFHSFRDDEDTIVRLTESQFAILKASQKIKRASISGCAGSGKTMLAIKKAEMVAGSGYKTLLCCFNTLLGNEFSYVMSKIPGIIGGNYHSILLDILRSYYDLDYQESLSYLNDAEDLLELILRKEPPQFDAIIIDECQDFSPIQLEIIELFLNREGILYCFWDNNQRVIRPDFKLPNNLQPFHLDTNLRNTKKIFDEVRQFYYQNEPINHMGPEGREIKVCQPYHFLKANELKQKLTNEINDLVHNESIPPSDITVLTYKSKENSFLNDFSIPGIQISIFDDDYKDNLLRVETVRRFKGMESSVVIVTELDDYSAVNNDELWENLCYIAFSRAKHYLIILSPNNVFEKVTIKVDNQKNILGYF